MFVKININSYQVIISFISTKYIQVYTAVIEGMFKTQKTIKNGINNTSPNGAAPQASIREKSGK